MSQREPEIAAGLLFPTPPAKPSNVQVFLDEIKPSPEVPWAYLAILSLPTESVEKELCAIQKLRDDIGYQRELKFSRIKNQGTQSRLGQALVRRVVNGNGVWHFGVVGIDMTKLSRESFGVSPGEQIANAHRRFLRSALLYHLKRCHASRLPLVVDRVFHDNEGRLEADPWFQWHAIDTITTEVPDIQFARPHIEFIDSNHDVEQRFPHLSHFIQLADLIVGATRYAFDMPRQEPAPGAEDVAVELLPLLRRMNDPEERWNQRCSHEEDVSRCHLGFFPSLGLTLAELANPYARGQSKFYVGREIKLLVRRSGQYSLPLHPSGSKGRS